MPDFAKFSTTVLIWLLVGFAFTASGVAQRNIAPPPEGKWVLDQTGTLTRSELQRLEQLCAEVAERSAGELGVAIIRTTRGKNYEQFATELFNHWGVGSRFRDDGILIFVAKDDRKAQIVLGDGVDSVNENIIAQQIFDREMQPRFRNGEYAEGVYRAAYQCVSKILKVQNLNAPTTLNTHRRSPKRDSQPPSIPAPKTGQANAVDSPFGHATTPLDRNSGTRPIRQIARTKPSRLPVLVGLVLGTLALGGIFLIAGRWMLRTRQRFCPKCHVGMVRLNESQEDQFLDRAEALEERLGSVNYDVWACATCDDAIKLRYGVFFTRYSACPRCTRKTKNKVTRTLVQATQRRTGVVEVVEKCANCDFYDRYTYDTPRLPDDDDDSSFSFGSSSGGSWGGGSSFGGGSSSSSSFGGGSSSGGGGGGGW